ncbi:HTH-type transcriptional repressor NicR [Variibacter gotjawalensis]|uniref:HTH-type transcriptional repressor NicR n=1 Tax=Variibacter gotjawalensis TaxID=1333996 RepID=A0A0S3PZX0_9BRAD|nr:MarR family transcriptional regulator [Variibacter gotjawalensis]NIK47281.1 DNA-binding MarR family transcriptional regulator [Variibacter gotjawalensis]RZS49181.1 MarR family transcriptional regulator [Variibacter gotjawalensis]BAT61443.1 HTH-type transcriptional repressor NicR [Variibacter gotjawalensis]
MVEGERPETKAVDAVDGNVPDWPLGERPGFLVRRLHQIHVSLFAELCADAKITPLQFSLLSALSDCLVADQSTLASMIALDRTTTTGALKRLEARGLVRRANSPTDRRAQLCQLTTEGERLLRAMEDAARRAHAETISPLSAKEQEQFVSFLKRIVAAHDSRL